MTSYIRVQKKFRERLTTPLEGLVYQQVLATQPATAEEIEARVLQYLAAHPEDGSYPAEEVRQVIDSLAERGFLAQPEVVPAGA